jgi:hypothetical protein
MAKKDKKAKVPKKVGDVKVPKKWRKSAKAALELAQNPIAREILAAALVAGAGALTKRGGSKAAQPDMRTKAPDLGNLIAQGVAAFVSGLAKTPDKKAAGDGGPEAGKRSQEQTKPLH